MDKYVIGLAIKTDNAKQKQCKPGFKQRGAVCQPERPDWHYTAQRAWADVQQASGVRSAVPHIINKVTEGGRSRHAAEGKNTDIFIPVSKAEHAYRKSMKGYFHNRTLEDIGYAKDKKTADKTGLTTHEISAIMQYARPFNYRWLNAILRGNDAMIDDVATHSFMKDYKSRNEIVSVGKKQIKVINAGLAKLPSFEGVSYRGLDLPQEVVDNLISTGKWHEQGFMSTTKDFGISYPGNVIMNIVGKSGKDISMIEPLPNKEILFPPGINLKVVDYKKIKGLGREFYVFNMEEESTPKKGCKPGFQSVKGKGCQPVKRIVRTDAGCKKGYHGIKGRGCQKAKLSQMPDREFTHRTAKEARSAKVEKLLWGAGTAGLLTATAIGMSSLGGKPPEPTAKTEEKEPPQPPKPKDNGVTETVKEPTEAMKSSPRVQNARYVLARIPGRNYGEPPRNNETLESVPDEYRQQPAKVNKSAQQSERLALLSRPFRQVNVKLPSYYSTSSEGKIVPDERKLSDEEIYTQNPTLFGGVNLQAVDRKAGKKTEYLPSKKHGIPPVKIEGGVVSGGGRPKRKRSGEIISKRKK